MEIAVLEKHLKKFQLAANIWSLVIGLLTALGICYGFYYKTTDKLDEHSSKIQAVETKVVDLTQAINNTAVYQGATKEQIKALQDQLNDVKNSQIRVEDKIGKLVEEIIKQDRNSTR